MPSVPGETVTRSSRSSPVHRVRLRFSVAHELGHLLLHATRTLDSAEREADLFAAELLTPLDAIGPAMPPTVTLRGLTMLKSSWGVSVKSLIRRAREVGAIDQQRSTSLYRQMSARGWNRVEPGYVPVEKPRAFRKLVELAYGPGPNVQRLAADAGWSESLALAVLDPHATADELRRGGRPRRQRRTVPSSAVMTRRARPGPRR